MSATATRDPDPSRAEREVSVVEPNVELDERGPLLSDRRYEVKHEIGRGGFGAVYIARDLRLERDVAIKVLAHDRVPLAARFTREARITARLEHPAIVAVHDAGVTQRGRPYYVMRRVDGETLKDAVAAASDYPARLQLVAHVTRAVEVVAFAHDGGVIHRDIKPHNIIVGSFGETFVIDWGLAKDARDGADHLVLLDEETALPSDLTAAGSILGTPAYMAPEQATGGKASRASDAYSLGAVLYEVLSGAPPFSGDSATVLGLVRDSSPRPIRELVPDIADDLAAIVDKALQPDPSSRYEDAAALLVDLRRFQDGALVGAHAYSTWTLLRRAYHRRKAIVWVTAVALCALGIVGSISVRNVLRATHDAEQARKVAVVQRDLAESQRLALMHQLADAANETDPTTSMAWLRRLLEAGEPAAALALRAESAVSRGVARHVFANEPSSSISAVAVDAAGFPITGHADGTLRWWSANGLTRTDALEARVLDVRESSDGTITALTGDAQVHHRNDRGAWSSQRVGPVRVLSAGNLTRTAFSDDGEILAFASRGDGHVVHLVRGRGDSMRVERFSGHTADVNRLRFSRDKRLLVSGGDDRVTRVWPLNGSEPMSFEDHDKKIVDLDVSPDGTTVASCGLDRVVRLRSLVTGKTRALEGHSHACWRVCFGATNDQLFSAGFDKRIMSWNLSTGQSRKIGELQTNPTHLVVSPDGGWLAAAERGPRVSLFSTRYGGTRELLGHTASITALRFTSETRLISAADDGSTRVWELDATNSVRLGSHEDTTVEVAVDPQGHLGASLGYDKSARIWDLDSHQLVEEIPTGATVARVTHAAGRFFIPMQDGGVLIWQPTGTRILAPSTPETCRRHQCVLSVSPDGAAAVMSIKGGPVTSWLTADGVPHVHHASGARGHVLFPADGTFLVASDEGHVFRGALGDESIAPDAALAIGGGTPRRLRAMVGNSLVLSAGSHLLLHDPVTGRRTTLNESIVRPWGMAVSSDGTRIAHGGFDSLGHLYTVAPPAHRRLIGHESAVGFVAFAPGDDRLLSAGADRMLRLWSTVSGESAAMYGHQLFVLGVAAARTPSGVLRALTSDDSGEIRVWNFSAPAEPAALDGWLRARTSCTVDFDRAATTPNEP